MARYYPRGSGTNHTVHNPVTQPGITNEVDLEHNFVADWLYGEWDAQKYSTYKLLNPIFHDYFDYLLDYRADQEYMSRYGLDWSDIHDPRKLKQTSSSTRALGGVYRFVSDNAKWLYR